MPRLLTDLDVIAEIRRVTALSSLRKVANEIGISAAYLSDVLRGNRGVTNTLASRFGFDRKVISRTIVRKVSIKKTAA